MPHHLPSLPYAAAALEPYLDSRLITLHHGRHHRTYVDRLNRVLAGHTSLAARTPAELLAGLVDVPLEIRAAVRQAAGGHLNHSLLWTSLSPDGGGTPGGALGRAIKRMYGDFEALQDRMTLAATELVGSGWAWLVLAHGRLEVVTTPNHDSPLLHGKAPLLGIDVWEHAYYLQYQDRRDAYVQELWKVVNWSAVERRYVDARAAYASPGGGVVAPTWYLAPGAEPLAGLARLRSAGGA